MGAEQNRQPFTDLSGAYDWLESHINFERQLGRVNYNEREFELDGFARRLERLGAPQCGLRTIHIAGTRGKGSTALALETLLRASGLRVATFTSPHIREYRERIRIDGAPLAPEHFIAQAERLAGLERETPEPGAHNFKTVFEHLTALFFLAAREAEVDWAIVEAGLGGRLDATNVIEPGPVVLTRIGLEHTRLLGTTYGAIASEKAAILKSGGWGIHTDGQHPEAQAVFDAHAAATASALHGASERVPITGIQPGPGGLDLELTFEGQAWHLPLPIYGRFQAENIQAALAMLAELRARELVEPVGHGKLITALTRLELPGRMQLISPAPPVLLDGCHCPTAARALVETLNDHFPGRRAVLALAMMDDKDVTGTLRALAEWPGWSQVWCYQGQTPRALTAERLTELACPFFGTVQSFQNLQQLFKSLDEQADSEDRGIGNNIADKEVMFVAAGSIYSIGAWQDWGEIHARRTTGKTRPQA